jgi:hypothetical protein
MVYFRIIRQALFSAFLMMSCSEKIDNSEVIVRVGPNKITFDEFYESYHLYPKYRQKSTLRQARLQQIEYMIERIHLQMAAERESFDKFPDIEEKIGYIKNKEKLKRLYEKNVLNKIEISEEEAWEEYKRSNIQIRMRHLYAKTKEQAQQLYEQLQQGADFAKLARLSFRDSVLANNGGDLGFLTITDLDPFLVDSVYNLRIGEISKPLRSSFGYHIVLVEDLKQSMFLSREYFEQSLDTYKSTLRKRRATKKSDSYVKAVLSGKSVDINPPIFQQLVSISKKEIPNRKQEYPFPLPTVTNGELHKLTIGMDMIKDSILVRFSGGQWTVSEFVKRLKTIPPLDRPVINREKEFIQNIIDMVRDELLLDQADRENIDQDIEFQKNFQRWKNALLAEEYFKRVYWVQYKDEDEKMWRHRKKLLAEIKRENPAQVDTFGLYLDVPPEKLDEKQSLINITIREPYIW